jgi:hypothetical protein
MYHIFFRETTAAEQKRFLPCYVTHQHNRWNSDLGFHNDH